MYYLRDLASCNKCTYITENAFMYMQDILATQQLLILSCKLPLEALTRDQF